MWRQNEKSPCYGYLASQREMPASRRHHFWNVATFSPTQPPWTTLPSAGQVESPPWGWRESPGRLPPTWGDVAVRNMVGLCSSSPHLTLHWALQLRGLGGSWGPGTSPLPIPIPRSARGPGHLSPLLFEPSAAAMKAPPLPSSTLKEPDLKLI